MAPGVQSPHRRPCSQAQHLSGQVQVDDEVLGGQGSEKQVQVSSCQPQGLRAGFGELDVIAGGDSASNTIHSAL